MDDALLVRGFEGFGDLLRDRESFVDGDGSPCDAILQCWAGDEFKDQGGRVA